MNNVLIIGVSQAIFLSVFLLSKKENKIANRLLAGMLFLIGFSLLLNYLYSSGQIQNFPHLIGLDTAFPFLYGPLLYFYARILVSPFFRLQSKDLLHLIPFAGYFIYVLFNFYMEDSQYKLDFLTAMRNFEVPTDIVLFNIFKTIQAFFYLFFTLKLIGIHQKGIENRFSTKYRNNLNWLKMLTYSLLGIYFIKLIGIALPFLIENISSGEIEVLTDLFIVLFVYLIAFGAIRQPSIFARWVVSEKEEENDEIVEQSSDSSEIQKYSASTLSEGKSQEILVGLLQLMTEEKVYLDNALTIKDLSDRLGVKSKYLSQVINEQVGKNFFNFVNDYRVDEVKRRLRDENYKHLSILGIALECGFNSKSSFNNVFKRKTGLTPTQYMSNSSS
jgi:AraC-like DNA-binding protein